eukprot:358530-Chlamydomonas_euryale.AAC.5
MDTCVYVFASARCRRGCACPPGCRPVCPPVSPPAPTPACLLAGLPACMHARLWWWQRCSTGTSSELIYNVFCFGGAIYKLDHTIALFRTLSSHSWLSAWKLSRQCLLRHPHTGRHTATRPTLPV